MQFNIPTLLTLFRVNLIPSLYWSFICLSPGRRFAAALIFCVAAVIHWFDGFLARRWNRVPGSVLSLTLSADKVLVAIAMVLVPEHYHSWWVTLPAATISPVKLLFLRYQMDGGVG
ncbi:CDP-alcohol phosphatidyltransferase family protein [Shigella flexneri]